MEHPCYKCQAAVEEGVPFCPHCGAPQIRVIPPESEAPSAESSGSAHMPPPAVASSNSPWGPPRAAYAAHRAPIHWNQAWQGALIAGAGAAVLSSLPFLGFGCFIWLLGAGALSVSMYQRHVPETCVTPGMGMRIGALAGVFAFSLNAIMSTLLFATEGEQVRKAIQEQMRHSLIKAPDPRTQQILQQFMDKLNTPEGMATFFMWILVVMAIIFVLFCAAGGAFGASIAARRRGLR